MAPLSPLATPMHSHTGFCVRGKQMISCEQIRATTVFSDHKAHSKSFYFFKHRKRAL